LFTQCNPQASEAVLVSRLQAPIAGVELPLQQHDDGGSSSDSSSGGEHVSDESNVRKQAGDILCWCKGGSAAAAGTFHLIA
jgi:hypothetical protein